MTNKKTTLLFVYNADSGIFNTLTDIAHKMFSPDTYECNLCAITHSYFAMREAWADYLERLNTNLEFLHRDELIKKYGKQNASLPAIFFVGDNKKLELAVDSDKINQCKTIEDLKMAIQNALN